MKKEIIIKKTPVKTTGFSIEISVLEHIDKLSKEKGYSKSAYVNKLLRAGLKEELLREANDGI